MRPATSSAYKLFHQGIIALSRLESVGMPVDPDRLASAQTEVTALIREAESKLRQDEVYRVQQRKFGKDCSLGSRDQLAWVMYNHLEMPGGTKSEKNGRYKLDEEALRAIDHPYVEEFLKLQKLQKLKGTYLDAFSREIVDGKVYGSFSLHNVKSFRGSADSPNLNNLPSRNTGITKWVKSTIAPPPGYYIVEIDYSALEIFVGCAYHRDPTMIDNLITGFDMHSSVSKQCYKYNDAWIADNPKLAKVLRTAAKGDATFSWVYGNWWQDVARRLWKTATKVGLLEHLASKGIKQLGLEYDPIEKKWIEVGGKDTMAQHIKAVENDFWHNRYAAYGQWRVDWYEAYKKKGFFETLTGFNWWGSEKRNFINNAPIQGSSFHCLLQSIITIDEEIRARGMGSRLILEIHDSLVAIVPKAELHDYVAMASDIMTTQLNAKWKWLPVQLKVEVEVSDISWYDKQAYTGKET